MINTLVEIRVFGFFLFLRIDLDAPVERSPIRINSDAR